MKIKVNKLSLPQLNYAVALCEGKVEDYLTRNRVYPSLTNGAANDWSIGGPIIDREQIDIFVYERHSPYGWVAEIQEAPCLRIIGKGRSSLVAAMRCYVSFKLGNAIEIPDELISSTD